MIEPLVSGIFAGDARRLSVDAAFPQLVERERRNGSLSAPPIDGKRGATVRPGASSLPPFVSFRGGMDELSRALRTKIDPRCVHVGSEVVTISRRGRGYRLGLSDGSRIEADAVVAAVPPQVVARVFAALDPGLAEAHGAVASASTVVVNLGYRTPDLPAPLDGYGYLTPMIEGRLFHGCTWSSNKWLGRAPEGHTAIRLYGGRFGEDALFRSNDEEILRAAKREPAETMGLPAEPVVTRITRWADAIPQYNLGYRSILRRIEESLAELPGVFLAGAVYAGVGIPDCIRSGNKAAADAVRYLYGRERR
jgi:oxygen-dependent protoporphyrinogen oxidase